MREILFRAKRFDNGEWVQGDLRQFKDRVYIESYMVDGSKLNYVVDFATVGQFTGLTAKNGKIFEGDIVENNECLGVVEYSEEDAMYTILFNETLYDFNWVSAKMCEVIGNIHDNLGLIGGADNG